MTMGEWEILDYICMAGIIIPLCFICYIPFSIKKKDKLSESFDNNWRNQ